ncbi:MAG TPA: hypothetical protein VLX11_13370 [Candidatus Acidoferrales bacterium]|nr:hypothetical protein [Candidatus Acidoferrales bacterium]
MATVWVIFLTLIYPLAIWLGQKQFEPRFLAVLLVLAALTRSPALRIGRANQWWVGAVVLLFIFAVWNNALLPLKLYPVLVNTAMLGVFGYTLLFPPSMAERFARIREPHLPPQAIGYTRRVTQVWCGFFALNGAAALITALWASPKAWWLYNGLIAYVLMGLLFAGEYFTRLHFKARYHD